MKLKAKTLLIITLILSFFSFRVNHVDANFEGFKSNCITEGNDSSSNSNNSTDGGTSEGDWLTEGTTANKNAKIIWDYWKGKGFGGVHISGVMGNVKNEGDYYIPDKAEGGKNDRGLGDGVAPSVVGSGYSVGGGGHYQFTPYTKYAPLGDKKWKDSVAQSDFVWDSEVANASWKSDYLKLTTPEDSAEMWSAKYERPGSYNPQKSVDAKAVYIAFGGKDVKPNSDLANSTGTAVEGDSSSQNQQSSICGNNGKSTGNGNGDIIDKGRALLGYFSYLQVHGEHYIGSVSNPKKDGVTDCSGFVWLVLKQTGYKVPDDMQWYTGNMESDAKGEHKWLEEIDKKDTKAGDIVIVNTGDGAGSNGHTAFLTEAWKDEPVKSNTTMVIQQGGNGDSVNEDTFINSFLSLVQGDYSITFARAIKE